MRADRGRECKKLRTCAVPVKFGCSCRGPEQHPYATLPRHRRLQAKSSQQQAPGGQCRVNGFEGILPSAIRATGWLALLLVKPASAVFRSARAHCSRLIVRGHWGIEDRLHWVRDVTYDEDRSPVPARSR
jgi:hypothetical protein